jgi:hypothetical protein
MRVVLIKSQSISLKHRFHKCRLNSLRGVTIDCNSGGQDMGNTIGMGRETRDLGWTKPIRNETEQNRRGRLFQID